MTNGNESASAIGGNVAPAPKGSISPIHDDARWSEKLRDGTTVLIRAIRDEDAELERRFIEQLSPQSRRFRFLGEIKSPDPQLLRQFTHVDQVKEVAFVALIAVGTAEREIGVSRYSVLGDGVTCECAIAVSDEWHNQGLATLLMNHLIDVARQHGISRMYSVDAPDNQGMRDLAEHLGFVRTRDPNDARQVLHTLDLNAPTV
ncbi:GNAT family N-acetyltransferase [Pseudolysobacter antarcticus]|uniref:GNAT family N-acetyltransferase n=1 Tax=Pseudolysobacter antarcticus TaxID=2511995 RepID=A0A411HKX0_9GAMM|nr:GNAT family N-acetyltransferase [Pseudolysobacter antarcticus]QBB71165.1 GNAT family N-acetyltransferase [Pseudolysobacter antarcticus]